MLPSFSASDESFIKYNTSERAVEIQSSTDDTFAGVFPAFRLYSGAKYQISFQIKSNTTVTSGVYFRIAEYDSQLPNGKTHISHSATHPEVEEDTREITTFYENLGVGTS